jgi:hypothetical protein
LSGGAERSSEVTLMSILGEGTYLTFKKGDLLTLTEDSSGETVLTQPFATGENVRTGARGDFPTEAVYVLPTITKPTSEILVSLHFVICEI